MTKDKPTELHPLTFEPIGVATANVLTFLTLQNQQRCNDHQQNNRPADDRDEQGKRDLVQSLKKGTA